MGGSEVPILQEVEDPAVFLREKVRVQIRDYKLLPFLPMKGQDAGGKRDFNNPLDWWRLHQHRFDLLALLARRILCIPATSAPSERVFSTAGHTITKLRASLSSSNAAALIYLHDSWPVAEE